MMRLIFRALVLTSCCLLSSCDRPANSSLTNSAADAMEAPAACPSENAIMADVNELANATDRSARAAILSRIEEKFSAVRRMGYNREDAGSVIVMKPACEDTRYPDIRLVSSSELFLLLGE